MWPLLALTGLKMISDNNNRNAAIESAAITQKYSPWTGQQADWGSVMKNNGMSTLISGAGGAMLQSKLDGLAEQNAVAGKAAADAADGDYYAKLSANPASVGVSPIAGKSAFAAAASASPVASGASRAPAVLPGGNQQAPGPSFQSMFQPQSQLPLMLQGQNPQQQNPWLMMAGAR